MQVHVDWGLQSDFCPFLKISEQLEEQVLSALQSWVASTLKDWDTCPSVGTYPSEWDQQYF